MIKSIANSTQKDVDVLIQKYKAQVEKFLKEFGVKDSKFISKESHHKLMETHFYWVDENENQGYHIPDSIEYSVRSLSDDEQGIYEEIYESSIAF